MATVADILQAIEAFAPPYMQEDWDNVGLLLGDRSKEVRKILVALDPFEHVCREAVEWGADLLLTHHPLLFRPAKSITADTGIGRSILLLASHGISSINAHTNLDMAPGGVNDALAQALGLENVSVMDPIGQNDAGQPYGLLRTGTVAAQSLDAFLIRVKERLHCPGLRYVNSTGAVRKVAVGGGACAGELSQAADAGCDTFVTADVKYNQFWDAKELGLNLIDAGHFYTENPICRVLAAKIREAFPDVTVEISKKHADCMNFFR